MGALYNWLVHHSYTMEVPFESEVPTNNFIRCQYISDGQNNRLVSGRRGIVPHYWLSAPIA